MTTDEGDNLFQRTLADALFHLPAKGVAQAIGANPAEVTRWARGGVSARAGVVLAMCHVPGDFGLTMRSAVRQDGPVRSVADTIDVIERAASSLGHAVTLLLPVSRVTPAPRAGRSQMAHATARVEEAIEALEMALWSLKAAEARKRAQPLSEAG